VERKKKLRLTQISLLVIGALLIFFTYLKNNDDSRERIVSKEIQDEINKNSNIQNKDADIFYDISYSGIDLNGNRYIIKSKEAENSKTQIELVKMKWVDAVFYFKDGTVLDVTSDKGIYNNKTLDIKFIDNIEAFYEGSTLYAQKANYSNSNNFLNITEKVIVKDIRGEIYADEIFFDLKKQTLAIESFDNKKVNANINLK
jgi:lipopolysaccharide export system protein LptA